MLLLQRYWVLHYLVMNVGDAGYKRPDWYCVFLIALTHLIYNFSFHRLPRNLFLYIFVCAFLPGALMIALKMFLLGSYYSLDGTYDWLTVKDNFVVLIPLMLFPEGMLNGMTMTLLIIYKPHWVYTFHDKFYIDGK